MLADAFSGTIRAADPIYFVSTDITGAQTQIDTNHMSTWIVEVNSNVTVTGGKFVMKEGSKTSDPLTFSIYQGALSDAAITSGTNNPFASITLSNSQFELQTKQQFNVVVFNFTLPVVLQSGNTYTAALTSAAPDAQSDAYFIKGGTQVVLLDSVTGATNTSALTLTGGTGAVNTAVPELSTYVLFGLGAVGLMVAVRRRKA